MKIVLLFLLQTMDLHEAVPINEGHICKDRPQEFHVFCMKSHDYNVKAFLGRLHIDVTIHQERQLSQKQEHQIELLSPFGQVSSIFMNVFGKLWPNVANKPLPRVNVDVVIEEKKSNETMVRREQVSLLFHLQKTVVSVSGLAV